MNAATDREADYWPLPGQPHGSVGTKHHLLPQLHQRYFGNERGMIAVVDRVSGRRYAIPIKDAVAERDFYTTKDENGILDVRSDHLLTWIEGKAAPVIERLVRLNLLVPFPPSPDQQVSLCLFLAFQRTRGRSVRRVTEMLGDLYWQAMAPKDMTERQAASWLQSREEEVTPEKLEQVRSLSKIIDMVEILPDPNAHIASMGDLAMKLFDELIRRPWYLAVYDRPSLVTCDEPVVLYFEQGRPPGHRLGVALADQIWFPLSPRHLLILGSDDRYGPQRRFDADSTTADHVNLWTAAGAYQSILMHPDHDHLADIELPEPGPLLKIDAPSFPELERYNTGTQRQRTRRH